MGLQPGDPFDPFPMPVLHFHHMGNGMDSPRVIGVDVDGPASGFLGGGVIARFLQGEGPHAEDEAVSGKAFVPGIEDPFDRRQHAAGGTHIEISVMGEPERQHVPGVIGQNLLPRSDRPGRVAVEPVFERPHMGLFAGRRRFQACLRRRQHLRNPVAERPGSHQQEEIALQAMGHDHVRVGGQGVLQQRSGFPAQGQVAHQGLVQCPDGVGAGGGDVVSPLIGGSPGRHRSPLRRKIVLFYNPFLYLPAKPKMTRGN